MKLKKRKIRERIAASKPRTEMASTQPYYPCFVEQIWFEKMRFCGCGCPNDVQAALRETLKTLDSFTKNFPNAGDFEKRLQEIWSAPDVAVCLALYVLDAAELTEHGGSVFGSWLTDDGKRFAREELSTRGEEP